MFINYAYFSALAYWNSLKSPLGLLKFIAGHNSITYRKMDVQFRFTGTGLKEPVKPRVLIKKSRSSRDGSEEKEREQT